MKITLKELTYENFKGTKKTILNFPNAIHTIAGDNGTGKTRSYDALLWLLFDKDSTGKKDFAIKPLDENNKVINKLIVSVSAKIDFDGHTVFLKKDYKEKWTKQRGSEFSQLTGHTTDHYFDDVPKNKKEFQEKVSQLISEDLFRLITDIFFFNNQGWEYRRDTLIRLAGDITDNQIAEGNDKFVNLVEEMKGKDIKEYRTMLKSQIQTINKRATVLPTLVNENKTNIQEVKTKAELDKELASVTKEIEEINKQIEDKSNTTKKQSDAKIKIQETIFSLKTKKTEVENKVKTEQSETKNNKIADLQRQNSELTSKRLNEESKLNESIRKLGQYNSELVRFTEDIRKNTERRAILKEMFGKESKEELIFEDGEFVCPQCLRKFEEDNIFEKKEELQKNFNFDRSKKLEKINEENKKLKNNNIELQEKVDLINLNIVPETKAKEDLELSIKAKTEKATSFRNQIEETKEEKVATPNPLLTIEIENLDKEIAKQEEKYNKKVEPVDTYELKAQKNIKVSENDTIKTLMNVVVENDKKEARIEELEAEELTLNSEKAQKEKQLYILEQFEEAKIGVIEQNINDKFSIVKFKMFKDLINGGTEATCITLVDGVPYDRGLNTASRINAGIDIINAISNHTNKFAPIFVDNAESVSEIIPTQSQLVRLEKVLGLNELVLS